MSKITVENVSYIYSKGTPYEMKALDNVSVHIEDNAITGIIGHTGSGKSTLVQMFNGLIKPTSGRILLDGEDIWARPGEISSIRFRVGLVMQYPEYQLFEDTVGEDIAFGPKNMGLDELEVHRRVVEAAEFVGLDSVLLDKSPFELSGGQKRRAAIAGVLAMRPEVLVLDEPAAGLDPMGRSSIFNGIQNYEKTTGAAVIIVSHSMDDMAKYCENVIVLSNAAIAMSGKRNEVFARGNELESIGLGVPQITRLMLRLRDMGVEVPCNIYTVDDAERVILQMLGGSV